MKIPRPIPSMRHEDGSIKTVMTARYTPKNFRRLFPNQAFPLLGLFANRPTQIVLYLLANMDSSNMVYATYESIMRDCQTRDKKTVAKTLRELQEAEAIVEVSTSHYMVNPAVMLQGNDQKFGLLAMEFNRLLDLKEQKDRNKKNREET